MWLRCAAPRQLRQGSQHIGRLSAARSKQLGATQLKNLAPTTTAIEHAIGYDGRRRGDTHDISNTNGNTKTTSCSNVRILLAPALVAAWCDRTAAADVEQLAAVLVLRSSSGGTGQRRGVRHADL